MMFHKALASCLHKAEVDTIFGVIGDANLFAVREFTRIPGCRYYSMAHEAGAVLAAGGYAHTSGRLGVAVVTHGPGLTNTVTPLVEGVREHTPILLITGDTAVVDIENLQNIAQREIVTGTGAGFVPVRAPQTLIDDLDNAIRLAVLESRPVVLNIPADFQWADVGEPTAHVAATVAPQAFRPSTADLDAAMGVVASAHRPLILAGRGAATPQARESLLRLADRIGAAVATTLKGRELFRGHPRDIGIFGTLSRPATLEVIEAADVVVAFGAALHRWTTADNALLRGKALVHIDTERSALGRWSQPDVPIIGDSAATADEMVRLLDQEDISGSGFTAAELAARINGTPTDIFQDESTGTTVDIRTAMQYLEQAFPADRSLVIDGGRFVQTALATFTVPAPSAYVHTLSFGSIGPATTQCR